MLSVHAECAHGAYQTACVCVRPLMWCAFSSLFFFSFVFRKSIMWRPFCNLILFLILDDAAFMFFFDFWFPDFPFKVILLLILFWAQQQLKLHFLLLLLLLFRIVTANALLWKNPVIKRVVLIPRRTLHLLIRFLLFVLFCLVFLLE